MKSFPFCFTTFSLLKAASGGGSGSGFLSTAPSSCPSAAGRDEEGTETPGRENTKQRLDGESVWSPKEIGNRSSGGVTVSFVLLKGKRKHIRKPDCGAQEVSLCLIKRN